MSFYHKLLSLCLFGALLLSPYAQADELRPAYLQFTETKAGVYDVFFRVPARGEEMRLALEVVFDPEIERLNEPLGGFDGTAHNQFFTIARSEGLNGATVTIANLERTSTEVLLRIAYQNGAQVMHRLTPDSPSYVVAVNDTWLDVATTYFVLGVEHILFGIDHLLFVFALLLLIDSTRKLIYTITFFTIAHSITLSLASLGVVDIPIPPVEAIIALSILFVALEVVKVKQGHNSLTFRKPWIVAFSFGLLHGLGFAAALGEIGLPQNAVASALVLFNVGVEIGQLLFVFSYMSLVWLASKLRVNLSKAWQRVPPYVIGSLASFWVIERTLSFWS
ncbi:HupE/UreJ family protein [Thalassotalea aquiviva]|uniref:HupE/UreJ family protein n=1 Tax=Thalassotalea aquiviva TaxID=3242415 RepID=UPI00352B3BE8